MKLERAYSLEEIANLIDCRFVGSPDHKITGINEIHVVTEGDIVFVDHPKYYDKALQSAATTILIDKEVDCPEGKGLLISENPFDDFNKLTRQFRPTTYWSDGDNRSPKIGSNTHISPNVSIGERVEIGSNCHIHSGVVLNDDTKIGDDVIIHANAVIGGDAFYYKKREKSYNKMHTCGGVWLKDKVEIGPLCTIDRGVTGITTIGEGSKLDAQVHVGHDTVIGKDCLFAAQVGIAGCVVVEDEVTLWGQVGIPSDVRIGKGATLLGQSGLMGSAEPGKTYFGSPAAEAREKFRELALIRKLPTLFDKND